MHTLPDPGPLRIGEARGLASDSETLCLGARYRTQRLPGTRLRDTEYYLFILFIFCVKLHYSRCSPPNMPPNRPDKKHSHNSLSTKTPFFMPFFSYVMTYYNGLGWPPRHGFIKTTFSIAEIRGFDCHNDSIVEPNYSVIDRQYETMWFCSAFNQQLSNNGHRKTGEPTTPGLYASGLPTTQRRPE